MKTDSLVPITGLAAATGLTSRTLRHYEAIGLLIPAATGPSGVRYYGPAELERLQGILVLRELGLSLSKIGEALDLPGTVPRILEGHLKQLEDKVIQIQTMIAATRKTMKNRAEGTSTRMEEMFEGFDHTQYKEEVQQRWGKKSYEDSDKWWRSKTESERAEWKQLQDDLLADWRAAATSGLDPAGAEAQKLAERQENWLGSIPGTPGYGTGMVPAAYLLGLADMYVSDERFGANYGGQAGAQFVREALRVWVANRR